MDKLKQLKQALRAAKTPEEVRRLWEEFNQREFKDFEAFLAKRQAEEEARPTVMFPCSD